MGNCSGLVAALTGCKSIVALNLDFESLGTRCSSACQEARGQVLINLNVVSLDRYLSRNFLGCKGYFLTLTLTGVFVSSRHIFIGLILAGPPLSSLKRNMDLCFSIVSRSLIDRSPVNCYPFASSMRLLSSSQIFRGSSSPKRT